MLKRICKIYTMCVIIAAAFFVILKMIGVFSVVAALFIGFGGFFSVLMVFASIPIIFYFRHNKVEKHVFYLPISYIGMFTLSILLANTNQVLMIFQVLDYSVKIAVLAYAIYVFEKKIPLVEEFETSKTPQSRLAVTGVILGVLSFIPIYGIFIGIGAIVTGIMARKKENSKLGNVAIVLGILGILFTPIVYGTLFYFGFMHREGIYDGMRAENVKTQMHDTVNAIEAYKSRFGEYPEMLENISRVTDNPSLITDEVQIGIMTRNIIYYYERKNDSYYLFSRGLDGVPFTQDDVYPEFEKEAGNIGLIPEVYS